MLDAWRVDQIMEGRPIERHDHAVLAAALARDMLARMGFGEIIQRAGVEYMLTQMEEHLR